MGFRDIFKDKETREIERNLEARRGKAQIKRHIGKQREMSRKLWEMGKRALALGDKRQFASIGKHYLWTQEDIKRWDRYLLAFESIEARRDQARSMAEFMGSIQAMSKSILASASPKSTAETQKQLEMAMARAQNLEQMLDYMMDVTDETVFNFEELGEGDAQDSIRELERELEREVAADGERARSDDGLEARIAEGLRQIEQEMRKDINR